MAHCQKPLLIGIALAGIFSTVYVSRFAYQEWQDGVVSRVQEASRREIAEKRSRLKQAAWRLSTKGTRFEVGSKSGLILTRIDFSQWRGTHEQLVDLKEFNLLKEVPHYPHELLSIVLGPRLTDSDLPILVELHVLSKIDVTGSGLSNNGIQKLCTALPQLTVGEIDRRYFSTPQYYNFQ